MAFNISVKQGSDEAIIKLSGELDAATAPQLKETIEKVAEAKPKRLVFDVSELEFMASAGLRVLIFAQAEDGRWRLAVCDRQPRPRAEHADHERIPPQRHLARHLRADSNSVRRSMETRSLPAVLDSLVGDPALCEGGRRHGRN